MKIFNFHYQDIEGLTRLDPEYYDPALVSKVRLVRSLNSAELSEVCDILPGPAYRSSAIHPGGRIPIAKIGDVTNQRAPAQWDRLEAEAYARQKQFSIQPDDILITLTGDPPDVGKVYLPFSRHDDFSTPLAFNQRVALLRSKTHSPFYLYAILSSEYFRAYFEQCALGIRQRNVSIPDLKNAPVYLAKEAHQKQIAALVEAHLKSRTWTTTLYNQARTMLHKVLNLDLLPTSREKGYTTSLARVLSSERLDPNHFKPVFERLENLIRSAKNYCTLGSIAHINRRGVQPTYRQDGNIPVVTSKHLSTTHLDEHALSRTSQAHFEASPEAQIQQGDILTYTTGAYAGRTNAWLPDQPALASNHINILRLRAGSPSPLYIAFVLNSIVGQLQAEKHLRGTAQAELYPGDIAKILIPLPEKAEINQISQLVAESYAARQEARAKINQAVNMVDRLIWKSP